MACKRARDWSTPRIGDSSTVCTSLSFHNEHLFTDRRIQEILPQRMNQWKERPCVTGAVYSENWNPKGIFWFSQLLWQVWWMVPWRLYWHHQTRGQRDQTILLWPMFRWDFLCNLFVKFDKKNPSLFISKENCVGGGVGDVVVALPI